MTRRSDKVLFGDMLDASRKAVEYSRDRTRADLGTDELYALAMTRLVEVVGEAASRVSIEGRKLAPNIPWQDITGTRNRLIHAYAAVDLDILWSILSKDLPSLIDEIQQLLGSQPD